MLTIKDYCDYDTCVALKELGYNDYCENSYITENTTTDCVDMFGDLYEADFGKGDLINLAILNNKHASIPTLPAPSLYEAQKWLREEHNIHILPTMVCSKDVRYKIIIWGKKGDDYFRGLYNTFYDEDLKNDKPTSYNSYEEALLEGIKKAVKLLKEEE